jgi:hypothetical protein
MVSKKGANYREMVVAVQHLTVVKYGFNYEVFQRRQLVFLD